MHVTAQHDDSATALPLLPAGVYEQLLAKRGPLLEDAVPGAGVVLGGSGDGTGRNQLRLRLLASLAAHCRIVVREELAPGLVGQVRRTRGLGWVSGGSWWP